jgi:hypothetical protein
MDKVYEYAGGEPLPLWLQIRISIHLFFCPDCAQEMERFQVTRDILRSDFLPPSPDFEDPVMNLIAKEAEEAPGDSLFPEMEYPAVPGGMSTRQWAITGLIVLISLASAFFGLDFHKLAAEAGVSFLLPVGITIGAVLTIYGALFIGSHLEEFSDRFGLR